MTITHNQWKRAAQISWLLTLCFVLCSCSSLPTWITTFENVLPTVQLLVSTILSIIAALTGKTIAPAIATLITTILTKTQAGLAQLQVLVNQYKTAAATATAGILADITTAVGVVIADLQSIFTVANIEDAATQAKITAFVNLILTALQEWASLVPIVKAAAGTTHTITIPPTPAELVGEFDVILETKSGNPTLDSVLSTFEPLKSKQSIWSN